MEGTNWAALAFGLAGLSAVVSAGGWLYAWVANRNRATDKDIRRLSERLTVVEAAIESLPTDDAIHALDKKLTETIGELKTLGATLVGNKELFERLEETVKRHEDHLLRRS